MSTENTFIKFNCTHTVSIYMQCLLNIVVKIVPIHELWPRKAKGG